MIKHIQTYVERLDGSNRLCAAIVSQVLLLAIQDGVKELLVSPEDYENIEIFMSAYGQWNWDRKTFWDMKITVIK